MNSKDFTGSNANFHAKGFNEKELRAHVSDNIRITAWELSDEDLKIILETRTIYLLEAHQATNPKFPAVKLVSTNPVPLLNQLQFPVLNGKDTTSGKKDAKRT